MSKRGSNPGRKWGLLIGGVVTLATATLYLSGPLDGLALGVLDYHFRRFNRIEPSDRILMIDINDYAVERIHRWPWPRRLHAELIDTLNEFGASAIVMDVVFAEPMAPRLDHPLLSKDVDVDPPGDIRGSVGFDDLIRDDDELAQAMQRGGNVYLAMFYHAERQGDPAATLRHNAERIFIENPGIDVHLFHELAGAATVEESRDLYYRLRIRSLLAQDFQLTRTELANRLGCAADVIDRHLAPAKRHAARMVVTDVLSRDPDAEFSAVRATLLPGRAHDDLSPDRADILRAYRTVRALRGVLGEAMMLDGPMLSQLEEAADVTVPVDKLAHAARQVGFVIFEADLDGVVRRLPLMANLNGQMIKQLGFAAACDLLGIDDSGINAQDSQLLLTDHQGNVYQVPLETDGRSLINWYLDPANPTWQHSFTHLPVTRIMELVSNRSTIRKNQARLALRTAEAVRLACGDQESAYADYANKVRQRNRLQIIITAEPSSGTESSGDQSELSQLNAQVAALEKQSLQLLAMTRQQIKDLTAESAEEVVQFAQVRSLSSDLLDGLLSRRVEEDNAALHVRNEELEGELGQLIDNKICFVGYTATAVADFVNTPIYESVPGVLAHANLVNTLLQNRFPRIAPPWVVTLLIVLSGLAISVWTATKGPWPSLIAVLLALAAIAGASSVLFATRTTYIPAIGAMLAVFLCWAFITVYRQMAEQKTRRQVSRALAQYTSPAVANQIAQNTRLEDLVPQPREVTCFFSDLKGFTSISERLGAERTRDLLNPYLEAMSQVLLDHRAMINKFMGDGIFAFLNPPILACADHAVASCRAALASQTALAELIERFASTPLAEDMKGLAMRVGINSGTVFVGDYGSANKLDYTCIGDAVNLAARLEPANKFFGTATLISQATKDHLDDSFLVRPLGKLQVVGKQEAVGVFELVRMVDQATAGEIEYVNGFAEAVSAFQERRWKEAIQRFDTCRKLNPTDQAAIAYASIAQRYQASEPSDNWNQGIELTSK